MAVRAAEDSSHWLSHVDEAARSVQVDIWKRRLELWNGNPPTGLAELLDPGVALAARGYKVKSVASIGEHLVCGVRSEVAGEIDRDRKVVAISQRFYLPEQRFTLAHELGHDVCHPNGGRMHRDLPLGKSGVILSRQEIEANRFASSFLMPRRYVLQQFSDCFRTARLQLSDETARALCNTSADRIRQRCKSLRHLSMFVAGTDRFDGLHFLSLAEQFRVSNTAMAIRLEELGLVAL